MSQNLLFINKKSNKLTFSILFFLTFTFISAINSTAQQTARHIQIDGKIKGFYEYLPPAYNPNKKYPLLLFFHGIGELGNGNSDLPTVLRNGPPKLINNGTFPSSFKVNGKTFSFIVISPQFTSWPGANDVDALIEYCKKHYSVDLSRIYLTGLSMGGGVVWDYVNNNDAFTNKIAAVVPVSGASYPTTQKAAVIARNQLPVWALQNDGDPTVPSFYTVNYVDYINQFKPTPNPKAIKTMFHANSHDAWTKAYDPSYKEHGKNVYEWMLQYTSDRKNNNKVPSSPPPPNKAPVANVKVDNITLTLPTNHATLDGSTSSDADGTIASYAWTEKSGPSAKINSPSSSKTDVNNLSEGNYVFTLTVKDNDGATAMKDVKITVKPEPNKPPVANAGADITVTLPVGNVTLDGSKSSDPDGNIVSYSWKERSGPAGVKFQNAASAKTTISNLSAGNYVFTLTVKDNNNATAQKDVKVTVKTAPNKSPVANAGADVTVTLPVSNVTLDGSKSSDPDGKIVSYSWQEKSGPAGVKFQNAASTQTTISNLSAGSYIFTLSVKDNAGATTKADVRVTVNAKPKAKNQLPNIVLNPKNATIILPQNSITLDGSKSFDKDGKIVKYWWGNFQNLPYKIQSPNAAITKITGLKAGKYKFGLFVTDNDGAQIGSYVYITVKNAANKAPLANAGQNMTLTMPVSNLTLDGSKSSDPDGNIVGYSWQEKSGPSDVKFANASSAKTAVNNLSAGSYVFSLTVKDNAGATTNADVNVTVKPQPKAKNELPTIILAPKYVTVTLPQNSVTLDGSKSFDKDGKIVKYWWGNFQNLPYKIQNPNAAVTKITGLKAGKYAFGLFVTDNDGGKIGSYVYVTVKDNTPPVANAGKNSVVTLPVNNVTLDGSASSGNNSKISSYSWKQIAGPSDASISEANDAKTQVSNLKEGKYTFTLTVKDSYGGSDQADVKLTVKKPKQNELPNIILKPKYLTITLPQNSITLDGSGSFDEDGKIVKYWWRNFQNLPYKIQNPNAAVTKITGLKAGKYAFGLFVTDNDGGKIGSYVYVTVKNSLRSDVPAAKATLPPVADAGPDLNIQSNSSVKLNGSNSYAPEDSIIGYSWKKLQGPDNYSLLDAKSSIAEVKRLAVGKYLFQLTVTNSKGETSVDSVVVNAFSTLASSEANGMLTTDTAMVESVDNKMIMDKVVADQSINIYPNPATDNFNLYLNCSQQGNMKVSVFNMMGELLVQKSYVKSSTIFKPNIDISKLPVGIYLVQIKIGNYTTTRKLVKAKQ